MSTTVHDAATRGLRRISQRYTAGRRALVDVLDRTDRPLTIPEILAADPSLASSSVYRNLSALEQAGVVSKVVTAHEHARYELSEVVGHRHHHHIVCDDCGQVADVTLPDSVETALDQALRRAAKRLGYEAGDHRVDLSGVCPECQTG